MSAHKDILEMFKRQDEEERRLIKSYLPEQIDLIAANIQDLKLIVLNNTYGHNTEPRDKENYKSEYKSQALRIAKDIKLLSLDVDKLNEPSLSKFTKIVTSLFDMFKTIIELHKASAPTSIQKAPSLSSKGEKPKLDLKEITSRDDKLFKKSEDIALDIARSEYLIAKKQSYPASDDDVINAQEQEIAHYNRMKK